MRFFRRAEGTPQMVAVLSGAFHPVTTAHLALARAALESKAAQEVLLVLPRSFPHKSYDDISLEHRIRMLEKCVRGDDRFSIGVSEGGLFLEIARECRAEYGDGARIRFLCGRDTAERIIDWDYGDLPGIDAQLGEYELLVAPRQGNLLPPSHLAPYIHPLAIEEGYDAVSSTEVRERVQQGGEWRHLVPEEIHGEVEKWYGNKPRSG
jgi:nicotinate (nicotinamide) nucleotide adenylyltransferase